jgi:FtsZ-interacting cell division protein ZipA
MIVIVVIVSLIALFITHYMWVNEKTRKEKQQAKKMERFENLMETLKKQNSDKNDEVSDTTKAK